MTEKWNEVFRNEELAKKVVALSPEEAQKILSENGFDFTLDEILEAGKEINELLAKYKNGEISEEDLAEVSGGGHGGYFLVGIVAGVVIASCGW